MSGEKHESFDEILRKTLEPAEGEESSDTDEATARAMDRLVALLERSKNLSRREIKQIMILWNFPPTRKFVEVWLALNPHAKGRMLEVAKECLKEVSRRDYLPLPGFGGGPDRGGRRRNGWSS